MTETQSGRLFNYLEKVRALIAKAERTDVEVEKLAFMAKAQELMQKYRIDEEALIASGDPTSATPIQLIVKLCEHGSEFTNWYFCLAEAIADHVGARSQCFWYNNDQKGPAVALVGYESDVRVAVEILTAAQLVFGEKLEPKKDDSLSEAENVYRLRSSGVTRRRVAVLMWGWEADLSHAAHAKVGRLYKEECAKRGERPALDGKGIDLATFRESYAREFYWQLERRLTDARSAVDAQGGVLILHGRKERVDEAFYGFYPARRPKPKTEVATPKPTDSAPVKKYRGPTKAQQQQSYRRFHSAAARAGEAAGGRAADSVQINRTTPRTRRVEEGTGGPAAGAIEG